MKLFLLAGEASGDLHGANLALALRKLSPEVELEGWGGPKMEAAGVKLFRTLKDLAFMGFIEVVKNINTVRKSFSLIKDHLQKEKPDALILIDYPGFNLKLASWAHKQDIPVYYFISPTVWAWKKNRMFTIRDYVKKLYCILPFETKFYQRHGITNILYVGNPLIDAVGKFIPDPNFKATNQLDSYIAVLPGSRMQELKNIFPYMVQAMAALPNIEFVIARTSLLPMNLFEEILDSKHPNWKTHVHIITDATYDVVHNAVGAVVTSGTATLETALLQTPQVVCYQTNPINYWIAKSFVNIQYISLVNLIADEPIVTELIQSDLNSEKLAAHMKMLALDDVYRDGIIAGYNRLIHTLGDVGVSERMAEDILSDLKC